MPMRNVPHECPAPAPLTHLSAIGDIDAAVARSHSSAVLIFKHSVTCGISAHAYDELMTVLSDAGPLEAYIVCVQSDRAVSLEIAQRFGIRHESPQLLMLVDGNVRWFASHYTLTASAIRNALNQAPKPEQ
jgi:bacillithiol system protein YtxJ